MLLQNVGVAESWDEATAVRTEVSFKIKQNPPIIQQRQNVILKDTTTVNIKHAPEGVTDLNLKLRPGNLDDAPVCGEICYEAFKTISEHHGFPSDFPSSEVAQGMMSWLFSRPDIYSVVAEVTGQVVGSNFLWEESVVAGIGPTTVLPDVQNVAVGRRLMEAVLKRAQQQQFVSVRLLQAAYHGRSLSLYTKLGFIQSWGLMCRNRL